MRSQKMNDDDEDLGLSKPCILCARQGIQKPFTIGHAARKHPVQWQNYIASKIDFGMAAHDAFPYSKIQRSDIFR